jgi:hypothetical protein
MGRAMTSEMGIDHGRMLDALGIEGRLLVATARDAESVAGTSGRAARDAVLRLGDLYEDALSWMGASDVSARDWALAPDAVMRAATDRVVARLSGLLAEFGIRPATQPCATWWPEDRTVGFWLRRMVHATAVHRVDLQVAAGVDVTSIDRAIALDGIDEALTVWFGYRLNVLGIRPARVCTVQVRAGDQRWLVSTGPTHGSVRQLAATEQSTEDGAIDADPQTVFLWLWGRLPDRVVRPTGDLDAIAQLWGLLRLATR